MNLFLLRHASAGTRRTNPVVDVKRPLDKDGKRHSLQLAYVLNALKIGRASCRERVLMSV